MLIDIWTVLRKELKEYVATSGGSERSKRGKWGLLFFLLIFGVFMPLQAGRAWVDQPYGLIYIAWIPLILVNGVVADSFAGERERHTLETLLASRLSDRAILLGKFGAAVLYGWGMSLATMVLSLVSLNVVHGRDGLLFYPAGLGALVIVIALLMAALSSSVGVLISLRASSARQAAQIAGLVTMLPIFAPMMVGVILPAELQARMILAVTTANFEQVLLVAGAFLVVIDGGFLLAAMARFKRARLILD